MSAVRYALCARCCLDVREHGPDSQCRTFVPRDSAGLDAAVKEAGRLGLIAGTKLAEQMRPQVGKLKPKAVWYRLRDGRIFDFKTGSDLSDQVETIVLGGLTQSFVLMKDGTRRPIQKPMPRGE